MQAMAFIDIALAFRDRENEPDPLKASWYLVAVSSRCSLNLKLADKYFRPLRWRVPVRDQRFLRYIVQPPQTCLSE